MATEAKVQLAPWARVLFEPSRYKAMHGGRGTGKSHNIASALVVKLEERPLRWLCTREVQASIKQSTRKLIETKIRKHGRPGFWDMSGSDNIRGRNGSEFIFAGVGTDPDKIRSMEDLDGAWVTEAAAISDISLEILEPTVRNDGSELWFDWNPVNEDDPVDVLFRGPDGPPPDSIVVEVTREMNPWFPQALVPKMEWDRLYNRDRYQHVWLGGYRRLSGAGVLTNFLTEEQFETPPDARFHYGADWGFAVDPTALTRSFIGRLEDGKAVADEQAGDCLFVDYEAFQVGCAIEKHPELFDQVPGARKWPIVADSSKPDMIDYMERNGFPQIVAAKKGPGSIEVGIQYLQQFRIVVHKRCPRVAAEMALYSFKVDRKTGKILPIVVDKHNHGIDSIRYAHEGRRAPERKLVSVSVPRADPMRQGMPSLGGSGGFGGFGGRRWGR